MTQIIYLMNPQPQITILVQQKKQEIFLMNVKVIFFVKKQMKLEKKLHKKEAIYNFLKEKEQKGSLTDRQKRVLKNIDRYLKNFKKDLEKLQNINTILHMAQIIYLTNSMKKTITNQQKSRVFLMVAMYYMKAKEIKIINQLYTNILI